MAVSVYILSYFKTYDHSTVVLKSMLILNTLKKFNQQHLSKLNVNIYAYIYTHTCVYINMYLFSYLYVVFDIYCVTKHLNNWGNCVSFHTLSEESSRIPT